MMFWVKKTACNFASSESLNAEHRICSVPVPLSWSTRATKSAHARALLPPWAAGIDHAAQRIL
jgi:hypothetical protein